MIDLKKYNEKEVVAAILAVEDIVNDEDFSLEIVEEDGEMQLSLIDHQGAYLGDIGEDRFGDLGAVINRMDIYHNDYFYDDYEERVSQGEKIPQDDWCRKILIFLESHYCQDLMMDIDVETYLAFKDKYLTLENGKTYTEFLKTLNPGEYDKYVRDDVSFDYAGYLCDKSIAMAILDTESAYRWFEHDGKFYLSDYGVDNIYESNEAFKTEVFQSLADGVWNEGVGDFWAVHDTYAEVIHCELGQIKDDMRDIGLYDDKDNWQFYLSDYELEYVGLGNEKDKLQEELDDIRMFSDNDFSDEFVENHLEEIVKEAKARAIEENDHISTHKADVEMGKD